MKTEFCCETMRDQVQHHCEQHGKDCPDRVVIEGKFSERLLLQAPNANYGFAYCPWCGTKLPKERAEGNGKDLSVLFDQEDEAHKNDPFSVLITGFFTKSHATEFVTWLESSGEQEMHDWFRDNKLKSQNVDCAKNVPIIRE